MKRSRGYVHLPFPARNSDSSENIPLDIVYEVEHLMSSTNRPECVLLRRAIIRVRGECFVLASERICLVSVREHRPGLVHALIKTQALLLVAKTRALNKLPVSSSTIKPKEICSPRMGRPPYDAGTIRGNIARSVLDRKKWLFLKTKQQDSCRDPYRVLERFHYVTGGMYPRTRRTHQIRVHFSTCGIRSS